MTTFTMLARSTALMAALTVAMDNTATAQTATTAPEVIYMCAVGASGVTYRTTAEAGCRSSAHTPFSFNAQGPTGPAGSNGRDGVDGADGKDGNNGLDGVNGRDGAPGQNAACRPKHLGGEWDPGTPEWRQNCVPGFKFNKKSRPISVGPKRTVSEPMVCEDPNAIVVAGGFDISAPTGRVLRSRPNATAATTWDFAVANEHATQSLTVDAWVICYSQN